MQIEFFINYCALSENAGDHAIEVRILPYCSKIDINELKQTIRNMEDEYIKQIFDFCWGENGCGCYLSKEIWDGLLSDDWEDCEDWAKDNLIAVTKEVNWDHQFIHSHPGGGFVVKARLDFVLSRVIAN